MSLVLTFFLEGNLLPTLGGGYQHSRLRLDSCVTPLEQSRASRGILYVTKERHSYIPKEVIEGNTVLWLSFSVQVKLDNSY